MKNIRKKFALLILIVVGCLSMGIKTCAADEQWFNSKLEEAAQNGNIYTVAQDGSGDYNTIQEGVDAVESGDTLIICPGVYTENVEIMAKTVNLLGVDKDTCILQYNTSDYGRVPLTVAAGTICNITICGSNSIEPVALEEMIQNGMDSDESEYEWQKDYSGYAVHINQNYLYGKELSFERCRIESYNSYCLGIGSRGNSKISLQECEILAAGDGGCIYLHDVVTSEVGGKSGLLIRNSILQSSSSPYIMTVHALSRENQMYLTFQGVKVYGVAYADEGGYTTFNMNSGAGVELSRLNMLSREETIDYMNRDMFSQPVLKEGITYIGAKENNITQYPKYVFNIYNADMMSGDGWCGLSNTWLTQDSFGNTLQDMNAPLQEMLTVPDSVLNG